MKQHVVTLLLLFHLSVMGGTIQFINGDQLAGAPDKIEGDHLIWQPEVFSHTLNAPLAELDKVEFSDEGKEHVINEKQVEIHMSRGDLLKGGLKAVEDDKLTLITDWGGEIPVKASMVKKVNFHDGAEVYLKEQVSVDDWLPVPNRKKWEALLPEGIGASSRAAICREVPLGNRFKVTFQMKVEDNPRIRLLFMATEGQVYEPESYLEVVVQRRTLTSRMRNIGDFQSVGNYNVSDLVKEGVYQEYAFYVDLEQKTLSAYFQNEFQVKWNLAEELPRGGNWLYLYSEYNGKVTMKDYTIKSWNGALPASTTDVNDLLSSEVKKPIVYLRNGDILDADVKKVESELISFHSELGDLNVPMKTVKEINFGRMPYDEPKREAGDMRVHLRDESVVTLTLKEWGQEQLKGDSAQVGEVSIKLDKVKRVEFNIYRD